MPIQSYQYLHLLPENIPYFISNILATKNITNHISLHIKKNCKNKNRMNMNIFLLFYTAHHSFQSIKRHF